MPTVDTQWLQRTGLATLIKKSNIDRVIRKRYFPRCRTVSICDEQVVFCSWNLYFYYLSLGYRHKNWWLEGETSRAFADLISEGDVVYDVGASCGYYSLLSAIQTGEGGTVVAFEPYDPAFAGLKRTISANCFTNIVAENLAVGKSPTYGSVTLFGRNPRVDTTDEGDKRIVSIDNYSESEPDVLKIDVEGLETDVLEGCVETISNHQPGMLLEIHSEERINRMGGDIEQIYKILSKYDRKVIRIVDGTTETVHDFSNPETSRRHYIIVT